MKATTTILKDEIDKKYPSTDPNVTEALLLTYEHMYKDLAKEIEKENTNDDNKKIKALRKELTKITCLFHAGMMKTLEVINQEV